MSLWAVLPAAVPLLTATLCAAAFARPSLQRGISTVGAIALLLIAVGTLGAVVEGDAVSVAFGDWDSPFGILFRVDRLGAAMILAAAVIGAATMLYGNSGADAAPAHPMRRPLVHGVLAGVVGAFSTADLFNLYVWFEVSLISALGLLALGQRTDQLDAAFKYLALNLFGTLMLLAAVGALYAATGQLQFDAIGAALQRLPDGTALVLVGALTVAFLFKAAAVPLFAWLPASYHTLPTPLLALFGGLLTKVGVYAVLRTFGDAFAPAPDALVAALGWVAVATMLVGALGAAYHWDLRRILAFHIVSQVGYVLLAIAIGGEAGSSAALFYTLHDMIAKTNLFLIAGLMAASAGSFDLRQIGGLYKARPALALLFALPALALVGIPPLSGFWAKWMVLRAALADGQVAWAVAVFGVSVLTLYSMMKLWMEGFWKPHPIEGWRPSRATHPRAWAACLLLAGITVAIGVAPQAFVQYTQAMAVGLGATP